MYNHDKIKSEPRDEDEFTETSRINRQNCPSRSPIIDEGIQRLHREDAAPIPPSHHHHQHPLNMVNPTWPTIYPPLHPHPIIITPPSPYLYHHPSSSSIPFSSLNGLLIASNEAPPYVWHSSPVKSPLVNHDASNVAALDTTSRQLMQSSNVTTTSPKEATIANISLSSPCIPSTENICARSPSVSSSNNSQHSMDSMQQPSALGKMRLSSVSPFLRLPEMDPLTDPGYLEYRRKIMQRQLLSESGEKVNPNMKRNVPADPEKVNDPEYLEKRRKNNKAAKKSRESRKAKEDEMAIYMDYMERENYRLKLELIRKFKEKNRIMKSIKTQ